MTDKAEFFAKTSGRRYAEFDVPTVGKVLIRSLSAGEVFAFSRNKPTDESEDNARWIVASVVDDDGGLLFGPDDLGKFRDMDFGVVNRIQDEIRKLNRLGEQTSVEDGVKNS